MLEQIAAGAGAGITIALAGWGKSKGEKFDFTKFGTTIVIGAVGGAIASVTKIEIDLAITYAASLGFTALVENGLKALKRRIWG